MSGPCLCGDPGCGACFSNPEPGDNEVVLIEFPGGDLGEVKYGELPYYGDAYEWVEELRPSELEAVKVEMGGPGAKLFFRLVSTSNIVGEVKAFPELILDDDRRNSFPDPAAALVEDVFLVCSGFVEGHGVEEVYLDADLAFEAARMQVEQDVRRFGDPYVRSFEMSGQEVAVWSRVDNGVPNRLIGFISIERHAIKRRERGETQVDDASGGDSQVDERDVHREGASSGDGPEEDPKPVGGDEPGQEAEGSGGRPEGLAAGQLSDGARKEVEGSIDDDPLAVEASKPMVEALADSIDSMFEEASDSVERTVSKNTLRGLLIDALRKKGRIYDA